MRTMKKTLALFFGLLLMLPAFLMIAQDAKTPDMKPIARTDAIEFENFSLKIDLLTAQREKLRMSLCEKYGLATTCVVGQKQDGQWVAVMPQLSNTKDVGPTGATGVTGKTEIKQEVKK